MVRITTARAVAVVTAVASPVMVVTSLLVLAALPPGWRPEIPATPDTAAGLIFPPVGAFLVFHRPRLTVAWLMCGGGFGAAVSELGGTMILRTAADGALVTAGYLRYCSILGWLASGLCLAVLLPLLSPDGRPPSRRWWAVAVLGAVALSTEAARGIVRPALNPNPWPAAVPNPLAIEALRPYTQMIGKIAWAGIYAAVVLSLLSLAFRFVRSDSVTRRQIAWPLLAFTGYVTFLLIGERLWPIAVTWAGLVPIAVAFSVMRYRLYGIDTIVSRAIVGGGLLAVISGVYFGAGALAGLIASREHRVAGLAAALVAGAFFQPLRRLLQRLVDRALYGRVGDPRLLAERLTQEVRRADPAKALSSVVTVLQDGLAIEGAAVEVVDGRPGYVESGHVGSSPRQIPLVWHGETVGRLLLGRPGPRRFAAAHDERVISTLAPYAADVAHAVRMAADLQRSRHQILTAREEERRRLRRDLHDGLGQTLSSMAMTINMARSSLRKSPDSADTLLRDLRTGMDAVSGDIRQLVYGLRPPALDDLGLAGAVRALAAEGPPPITVEVSGDLATLPAAVEVAAYRIVQEALTNVRRHARATRASIALDRSPDALRVRVTDDGAGLPERPRAGVGLHSMRERAAELGGTCATVPGATGGTTVEAVLPL
ncbi:sensor histidine kinase [Sphaerisporangium album]|uniref:Sensor histidine kinase n=1 Tax=Sphaerisporangium album TaxID=509200 RepID=A0A367FEX1_9ACTN|nr:sensor histidine kinase [Sphaerisporangium album]RCG28215.1 sensor histidine kinase [Sphaerisporangium album]